MLKLADQGRYLASESSFYCVLRAEGVPYHRGRAKPPVRRKQPTSYQASAPCEVWTRDITWMPGPVAGMFFYLYFYLIADIFSRKIVGWEVHERESADLAAILIRQAVLAEGCQMRCLVLHADNGSPMKGATMTVTMEKLGITASYSRPRVSTDTLSLRFYSEPASIARNGQPRALPPRPVLNLGCKPSSVGTTASTSTAPSTAPSASSR